MLTADTCLLVHSGDRGQWLWPNWYLNYKQFWRGSGFIDTVFLGENDFFALDDDGSIHTMMTGPVPWGQGLYEALDKIPCRWIIYHHEDYFLDGDMDIAKMLGLLNLCESHNFNLLKICGKWAGDPEWQHAPRKESGIVLALPESSEPIYIYDNRQQYTVSHQSSIWDRKFLMSTLIPGCTPWDHEFGGSQRLQILGTRLHAYLGEMPIPYTETVRQGSIRPGCYRFFSKSEIERSL